VRIRGEGEAEGPQQPAESLLARPPEVEHPRLSGGNVSLVGHGGERLAE